MQEGVNNNINGVTTTTSLRNEQKLCIKSHGQAKLDTLLEGLANTLLERYVLTPHKIQRDVQELQDN